MFNVTLERMKHSGGTKDYDIIVVLRDDGTKSAVIRRWGRVGATGQVKVDLYEVDGVAKSEARKLKSMKSDRGYSVTVQKQESFDDEVGLRGFIGPAVWSRVAFEMQKLTAGSDEAARKKVLEETRSIIPEPVVERGDTWGSW